MTISATIVRAMKISISSYHKPIVLFILLTSLSARAQFIGSWTPASSEGFIPRAYFGSAAIGSKIYVFKGYNFDSSGAMNSTQVYDVMTNQWSTLEGLNSTDPRYGFATCVAGNKIYLIGGVNSSGLNDASIEIFDPARNSLIMQSVTGTGFSSYPDFTAASVGGKIYVFGGSFDFPTSIDVFDPQVNSWYKVSTTGKFTGRAGLCACVVNDKIYAIGGVTDNFGSYCQDIQVFDPSIATWTTLARNGTFTPREFLSCAVLDGKIYALGGQRSGQEWVNTVEVFDTLTHAWSTPATTGTFTARRGLTATTVNGKIYAIGGYNGSYLNTNEVLNPVANIVNTDKTSSGIIVSPNPTNGIVTVYNESEKVEKISIVNIIGKTVLEITTSEVGNIPIDLSEFPAGIYFAKVQLPNQMVVQKIIRE